jgi:hypothetical protein
LGWRWRCGHVASGRGIERRNASDAVRSNDRGDQAPVTISLAHEELHVEGRRVNRYLCAELRPVWQFVIAGSLASLEVLTKMVLYYFHERIWAHLSWGMQ